MKRLRPALLLPLLAATVLRADHIEFKNGGKIEGVIVGETATAVTIKTGPGTATFKKAQLRSIFRDQAANQELQRAWQSEHFANPEFLPASLRPLAERYGDLCAKHAAARQAQRQQQQQREEAVRVEADLQRTKAAQLAAAAQLQRTRPEGNLAAYNGLVRDNNEAVTRYTLLLNRRQQLEALDATNRAVSSAYFSALAAFRNDFEPARARPATNEAARVFFERAAAQLAAMASGLEETRLPLTDAARGHAVVHARVNDRSEARLLVDTGASIVSLSAEAATRMKVAWDPERKSRARLADGSEIDVYPTTLASLSVAGSRLTSVPAIVIPEPPGDGVDGLLGMSFLREFDLQFDAARGQIVLRRLPPGK